MNERVNPLSEFPIFQLTGGAEGERAECMRWLESALLKRSLQTTLLFPLEKTIGLNELCRHTRIQDIVIIDSSHDLPVHKIVLTRSGQKTEPHATELFFCKGYEQRFVEELVRYLDMLVKRRPVWGCILIGGRSSRMGQPKHLIEDVNGKTWLERTVATLQPLVNGLVVSGKGTIPATLSEITRIPDVPDLEGPLTGILSAMRWQPMVSWLLVACDMPLLSRNAVNWLLAGRQAGCWGLVPRLAGGSHCEPLFSWYDLYTTQLFEEQALYGNLRMGKVAVHDKICNPEVPESLRSSWENVNTPEQLREVQKTTESKR